MPLGYMYPAAEKKPLLADSKKGSERWKVENENASRCQSGILSTRSLSFLLLPNTIALCAKTGARHGALFDTPTFPKMLAVSSDVFTLES